MSDVQNIRELLKSDDPNQRYDACEELMTSQQPLPQEVIDALNLATNDSNPDVADAAKRALVFQSSYMKPIGIIENQKDTLSPTNIRANKRQNIVQDLVIGFVGWIVFHNLWIFIGMGLLISTMSFFVPLIFIPLPFLMGLLVVIYTKRMWIGIGIVVAILTSTLIWVSNGQPLLAFLLPFPAGLYILF